MVVLNIVIQMPANRYILIIYNNAFVPLRWKVKCSSCQIYFISLKKGVLLKKVICFFETENNQQKIKQEVIEVVSIVQMAENLQSVSVHLKILS